MIFFSDILEQCTLGDYFDKIEDDDKDNNINNTSIKDAEVEDFVKEQQATNVDSKAKPEVKEICANLNEESSKLENDKLKNDLDSILNKKRGRERKKEKQVVHTKYSDDNMRRKCKHIVLENVMKFINEKIIELYINIGHGINVKKLLIINQKQITDATIKFNKLFLNKTLGEIFSEKISSRYTNYRSDHNQKLISDLINDNDENKKKYFLNLFNLKFFEVLRHFNGRASIQELEGLNTFDKLDLKQDEEYWENLKYYIVNYEEITLKKRERKNKEIGELNY